jgi:hypothetical protein
LDLIYKPGVLTPTLAHEIREALPNLVANVCNFHEENTGPELGAVSFGWRKEEKEW